MIEHDEGGTSETSSPREVLTPGANFEGRLQILELVGEGATAMVYKARHLQLDQVVALKLLNSAENDETKTVRFMREARGLSQIEHQNIVKVYSFGKSTHNRYYMVMEFIEGVSLAECLQEGALPPSKVLEFGVQVCEALSIAHSAGLIHRDLKPANIMVTQHDSPTVKVVDFGIAWLQGKQDATLTRTGVLVGTPKYMSPEQCRGEDVDGRSDIYSLGCILYEVISGRPVFDETNVFQLMAKHANHSVKDVPAKIGARFKKVILKCLAKEPGGRYQTAGELAAALVELQTSAYQPERDASATARGIAVAMVLLVVASLGFLGLHSPRLQRQTVPVKQPPAMIPRWASRPKRELQMANNLPTNDAALKAVYYQNWLVRFGGNADPFPKAMAYFFLSRVGDELKDEKSKQTAAEALKIMRPLLDAVLSKTSTLNKKDSWELVQSAIKIYEDQKVSDEVEKLLRHQVHITRNCKADAPWLQSRFCLAKFLCDEHHTDEALQLVNELEPFVQDREAIWRFNFHRLFADLLQSAPAKKGEYLKQCEKDISDTESRFQGSMYFQLAQVYVDSKRWTDAVRCYQLAARPGKTNVDPEKCRLREAHALCYANRLAEAAQLVAQAPPRAEDPENAILFVMIANALPETYTTEIEKCTNAARGCRNATVAQGVAIWSMLLKVALRQKEQLTKTDLAEVKRLFAEADIDTCRTMVFVRVAQSLDSLGYQSIAADGLRQVISGMASTTSGEDKDRIHCYQLELATILVPESASRSEVLTLVRSACVNLGTRSDQATSDTINIYRGLRLAMLCHDKRLVEVLGAEGVQRVVRVTDPNGMIRYFRLLLCSEVTALANTSEPWSDRRRYIDCVLTACDALIARGGIEPVSIAECMRLKATVLLLQGKHDEAARLCARATRLLQGVNSAEGRDAQRALKMIDGAPKSDVPHRND